MDLNSRVPTYQLRDLTVPVPQFPFLRGKNRSHLRDCREDYICILLRG